MSSAIIDKKEIKIAKSVDPGRLLLRDKSELGPNYIILPATWKTSDIQQMTFYDIFIDREKDWGDFSIFVPKQIGWTEDEHFTISANFTGLIIDYGKCSKISNTTK